MRKGLKGNHMTHTPHVTRLESILSQHGTEADRERLAIQWVESLPADEAERVVAAACAEWQELVAADSPRTQRQDVLHRKNGTAAARR